MFIYVNEKGVGLRADSNARRGANLAARERLRHLANGRLPAGGRHCRRGLADCRQWRQEQEAAQSERLRCPSQRLLSFSFSIQSF